MGVRCPFYEGGVRLEGGMRLHQETLGMLARLPKLRLGVNGQQPRASICRQRRLRGVTMKGVVRMVVHQEVSSTHTYTRELRFCMR